VAAETGIKDDVYHLSGRALSENSGQCFVASASAILFDTDCFSGDSILKNNLGVLCHHLSSTKGGFSFLKSSMMASIVAGVRWP